jgi:hypothetical protein
MNARLGDPYRVVEVVLVVGVVVATVLVVTRLVVDVVAASDVVVIGPVDDVVVVATTIVVDVVVAPGFLSDGTQSSTRRSSSSCWLPNWSVVNALRGVNFTPAFRVL